MICVIASTAELLGAASIQCTFRATPTYLMGQDEGRSGGAGRGREGVAGKGGTVFLYDRGDLWERGQG